MRRSSEEVDKNRLPAIEMERHLQVRRFWLLQHTENAFVLVFLITTVLGLTLREEVVRNWSWVPAFVDAISGYLPVVDMFWRVSPFPLVTQLLTAVAWISAFLVGLMTATTVRHLRFPAMFWPLRSARLWWALFTGALVLVAAGWLVAGTLTHERLGRPDFPWSLLRTAVQNQTAFAVIAGLTAGYVAYVWAVLCVFISRRLLPSLLKGRASKWEGH